jgi:site-specific recombinase XerD
MPQNINIHEKVLHVRGKGQKIRNVDVSAQFLTQMQLYIKTNNISSHKRIFSISMRTAYNIVKKHSNMNPHSFRHAYAINLLRKTMNIRFVQKQLGHSSLSTTQLYLQFVEYEQEKKKLESLY